MRIRELQGTDDPLVVPVFSLYHDEFDLACRDPDEQVWQEIMGKSRLPYRIHLVEGDGRLAGFMRWVDLPLTRAAFVVHIAVDRDWRGTGLGQGLLGVLPTDRPALFEVERVRDATHPEDRETRKRRLDWFARQGARLVTPDYTQPALHPDTEPVPLHLLAIRRELLPDLHKAVENFYREVWQLPNTDPLVQKAVAGVGR